MSLLDVENLCARRRKLDFEKRSDDDSRDFTLWPSAFREMPFAIIVVSHFLTCNYSNKFKLYPYRHMPFVLLQKVKGSQISDVFKECRCT